MRRHALNGVWVISGKVLAIVAGVLANAMLTRLMSPEEVGIYFLMISIASVAVLFAQAGQNQAAVRFIARLRGQGLAASAGSVVIKAFLIAGSASLMMAVCYAFFVELLGYPLFHSELMVVGSLWVAAWIVLNALRALAAECLRGLEEIRLATLFEGLFSSLLFALLLLFVWLNRQDISLYQVIVITTCSALLSMLFALYSLGRRVVPLSSHGPVGVKELLRTGLPLLGGNIVVVLMTSLGLWVVGYLGTAEDAAQYGAAARVMLLAQFPLLALNAMLPPMIARIHAEGNIQEMERVVRLAASVALLGSGLVMLVFLFWGGDLLALLFGSFYADARWILVFLCIGVVANAWSGFCGPVLMMTGYHNELVRMSLWAASATLLATWVLGRSFGSEGVALAMSVGMIVLHLLMWLAVRRHIAIWTHAGGMLRFVMAYFASR
ncbi:MAG: hypothetical protein COS82_06215 [Zetaproteobacteria bacterium CG06_land_8_20_14_3_00_59_53]|nr:MAG: hypothetical protein AUK36_07765 [Zetaproteobacteria bacterium CG2_30_59_37]PIO88987.1 MAG: hypothetical protein COX56_09940 [Zetaproteobacteria bacterium CG23_combo_of_CG06-09_8_20_14_all_59_86]PIQ64362.1 MAG: hypothetical protein COV97_10735 [Zetaproteobacteria bacterium CG11_big_fil_rev_8_21_14_0_20_59_439]PIU70290.1 MAG: hypothetical protein COS82_06215 [Zetaproteobacteria bacterium CG06_land_8_20_14_3_00_59_53]PIU97288.1 MAG: hypothetical protein COS62_04315 [Zetaproteobacteria bac